MRWMKETKAKKQPELMPLGNSASRALAFCDTCPAQYWSPPFCIAPGTQLHAERTSGWQNVERLRQCMIRLKAFCSLHSRLSSCSAAAVEAAGARAAAPAACSFLLIGRLITTGTMLRVAGGVKKKTAKPAGTAATGSPPRHKRSLGMSQHAFIF